MSLPGSSVAEQVTVNHLVAGSIPARAAISMEMRKETGLGQFSQQPFDSAADRKANKSPQLGLISYLRRPCSTRRTIGE